LQNAGKETPCNGQAGVGLNQLTRPRAGTYQKALDGRKRPIRGLWQRNGKYYARVSVEDPGTGRKEVRRVPLAAATVPQAQAELRRLVIKREENALPILKLTPKFREYAKQYLAYYQTVKDAKRPRTLETESGHRDID